ncbi:MAG TPA: ATP-binding protein [Tepidisphaeraceae bacterium]|nr:ATP-binding protein [Tepidisphaeraceae bacterium]
MAGPRNNHRGASIPGDRDLIDVTIPSDFAASRDLQRQVQSHLLQRHYSEESFFAIKLALEEALLNAIKHGNRQDNSKQVHVRITITPRQTEIIIEDQGPGFDRSTVPDPTLDENLEKCTGRGILLIESYMNKVQWSRGGRRLRMIRKNDHRTVA